MKPVGYSGKSLVAKLGYEPGNTIRLHQAPVWFISYLKEEDLVLTAQRSDWLHGFFNYTGEIATFLQFVSLDDIEKGLWVSWPKKSSGVETDVSEQTFRNLILPLGWVDTKVCAIDDTWSGLLFRRRKK